jgi:hypothetical protein
MSKAGGFSRIGRGISGVLLWTLAQLLATAPALGQQPSGKPTGAAAKSGGLIGESHRGELRALGACNQSCTQSPAVCDTLLIQCGVAAIRNLCRGLENTLRTYRPLNGQANAIVSKITAGVNDCVRMADPNSGQSSWAQALARYKSAQAEAASNLSKTSLFEKGAPSIGSGAGRPQLDQSGSPGARLERMEKFCKEQRSRLNGIRTRTDRTTGQILYNRLPASHKAAVDAAIQNAKVALDRCDQAVKKKQSAATGMADEAAHAVAVAENTLSGQEKRDDDKRKAEEEKKRKAQEEEQAKQAKNLRSQWQSYLNEWSARFKQIGSAANKVRKSWDKAKLCDSGLRSYPEYDYDVCLPQSHLPKSVDRELLLASSTAKLPKDYPAKINIPAIREKTLKCLDGWASWVRNFADDANREFQSRGIFKKVKCGLTEVAVDIADKVDRAIRSVEHYIREWIESKVKPMLREYVMKRVTGGSLASVVEEKVGEVIKSLITAGVNAAVSAATRGAKAAIATDICVWIAKECAAAAASGGLQAAIVGTAVCGAGCVALVIKGLDAAQKFVIGKIVGVLYKVVQPYVNRGIESLLGALRSAL